MRTEVKLENGTILKVGKKYVHATWLRDEVYEITAIGRDLFMYISEGKDYELTHEIDNDWIPYQEEKTEKWYEILAYNSLGIGNHKFCNSKNLSNYEVDIDILREWDSKEEMINDLKK